MIPGTVDEYLNTLPESARRAMELVRVAVKNAVPEAEEVISYGMPAFRYIGILVYYAAHKEHIGFYPADVTFHEVFKEEVKGYKTSRGTIRFPLNKEIPAALIERIARFRLQQNLRKAEIKRLSLKKNKR